MKLSKHKTIISAILAAASVAFNANAGEYKFSIPTNDDDEGAMAFLINYDTNEKVDSVLIEENAAVFTGNIDEAFLGRVIIDGKRRNFAIVEPGTITVDATTGKATGTKLNDIFNDFQSKASVLVEAFRNASTDDEKQAIYQQYNELAESAIVENADNIVGYYIFMQEGAGQLDADELNKQLEKYPSFKKYTRIASLIQQAQRRQATQPGGMFVDFEITYDGKTSRLSDYVGKGHYTLVDFWASWCGPCIRQTVVLKDIYNEYKDKGLEVLGVAVWDEPENTKAAIKQHELPWECIINAQTIPTDLYGITGIPCIILFDPDGKIVSRDKQDDELRADVRAAMEGTLK